MAIRQHADLGAVVPQIPEPSLAERARTLAQIAKLGSLSTHSRRFPGFPYGSMMPFAADDRGRPIFFISSMAMHTQNLQHDERSSLLITQPHVSGDPLAAARMALIGSATAVPREEVQELYLSRHENARAWQDFTDFSYYRLNVAGVYFIGGFGVMDWLAPEDYAAAAADPLASVAPSIVEHMNADHTEALRRIAARETGQFPDEVSLHSVDRLGFHLRLKTNGRVHERRIPFPREVRDARQARAVFIEMVRACS